MPKKRIFMKPTKLLFFALLVSLLMSCYTPYPAQKAIDQTRPLPAISPEIAGSPSVSIEEGVIRPGYGTEEVHLWMSYEALVQVLGKPREEVSYDSTCGFRLHDLQWFKSYPDGSVEAGDGIFAYVRDNSTYTLYFSTPRYRTQGNVGYGSSLNALKKAVPSIDFFRLTLSSSEATNNEERHYAIDKEGGIAYELGRHLKTKKMYVNGIYIFPPGGELQPKGCLDRKQTFIPVQDL